MLHILSALLLLTLVVTGMVLTGATLARSWNKVLVALNGSIGPVMRPAIRPRSGARARPVVLDRQRAWSAAI